MATQHTAPTTLEPGLYVVATPIGNLGDMTARAAAVLGAVDMVLVEDSRVSGTLFRHLGIKPTAQPYHEHNASTVRPRILERLATGDRVALISDAGTPLMADPGFKLVREAVASGHAVIPVPGPNAHVTALMAAGLPTDRVLLTGFLPGKAAARDKELQALAPIPATLVVLESPRRVAATLAAMAIILGPREACVAREMTKRFETFTRGDLATLAETFAAADTPKGEIVIVVAPPAVVEADADTLDKALRQTLARGASVSDAAKEAAAALGVSKKAAYARALALRDSLDDL